MKKVDTLFVSACLLLLFVLPGCSHHSRGKADGLVFDSIRLDESYYLFNNKDMYACNIKIDFTYPSAWGDHAGELKELQSLFVEKNLGESYAETAPDVAAMAYKDHYISSFKDLEIDDRYKTYFDNGEAEEEEHDHESRTEEEYKSYVRLKNNILYHGKGFLSFTIETTAYEGGARNSSNIQGYVINLNTMSILLPGEFEGSGYYASVSKLLAEKIARDNNLSSLEDIAPTDNFTLDNKGITYYFNESDIAGTMPGITSVFLPYEEVKVYMPLDNPISPLMR